MSDAASRKKINFTKSIETYNVILDATESLIEEFGIAEFTIHQVVKKSGFAIGTLYLYFDNKDSLLEGLLRREVLRTIEAIHETILPKLPMKSSELLYDCFLVILNNKKIHIYSKLIGMTSLLYSSQTGVKTVEIILENIRDEISESLQINLKPDEINQKTIMLFHTLRGCLSTDWNSFEVFETVEDYAGWLTNFSLSFLQGK